MSYHLLFDVLFKEKNKAIKFLQSKTSEPLYQIKEKAHFAVGGFFYELPKDFPDFLQNYKILNESVDWDSQWEQFSPNINNNRFELNLSLYGVNKKIFLNPGPGFGDLSHATTKLCLETLSQYGKQQTIIDYGCGSGILSVAAWAMNAAEVISIEIEPESILHTQKNLELNQFPSNLVFESLPLRPYDLNLICLINMTFGEQKIALSNLELFPKKTRFLSSGILEEQKQNYIEWGKEKGILFSPLKTLEGWMLFEGKFISN